MKPKSKKKVIKITRVYPATRTTGATLFLSRNLKWDDQKIGYGYTRKAKAKELKQYPPGDYYVGPIATNDEREQLNKKKRNQRQIIDESLEPIEILIQFYKDRIRDVAHEICVLKAKLNTLTSFGISALLPKTKYIKDGRTTPTKKHPK